MTSLLLVKTGGKIVAYRNACPHQGRRLDYAPGMFLVKDERVICPAHGAVFALQDGRCLQGPCQGESLLSYRCDPVPEGIRLHWPE